MQIGLLGPFEVRTDGGVVADLPGARLRALVTALALEPGRVVPRSALIDWIWGEHPPADAANALQRLVSRLRKVLPEGSVEGLTGGYRLVVDPDAVDAVRFERLVGRARDEHGPARAHLLREALALWRGAALQDVDLPDSAAVHAAAARLEEHRLTATEDRFAADVDPGSVAELTDLVAAHPLRERLVAALMRALAAAGRDAEALLVFERTRDALADALGADPSAELSAVHVALLRRETVPRNATTNVRAELTSFVGRDGEVAAVRALLAGHRLTTLVGPGGSGKTRLATETAGADSAGPGAAPDGTWLVELAAIGTDGDVAQATLAGLGLRDALLGTTSGAEPADRLVAAIRERDVLLILDNCEHVIEQVAALAHRLLGECRHLRILATSREPLGITGEALWPVEPLSLPDAVRLLRDRAGAVRRDADTDTAVRVCRALDGMPLAIELAAARLRTMSLDQLAVRLDDRFRLLTGGSRTALPRHRTLWAVVDWSWELLTDAERTVLRRLAVFSGGAGLEAAERVCADGLEPGAVERDDVLDLLTSLTEKSLLVSAGDGAPRYRMLTTIREYATHRLAEAGEADAVRRAHVAHFTELAETAEPHLRRAEQREWLATLEAEHDNIAAAMRGALAAGEAQAAMGLAAAAGYYWWLGGHRAEGIELLIAAADLPGTAVPGEVPDDVRAMVYGLIATSVTSGRANEHHVEKWIREAHRLGRGSAGRYPVLRLVVPLERLLEGPDASMEAFEPLLDDEDPWVRALARLQLGRMRILYGHGGPEAEAHLERALAEFRAVGERYGIAFALTELANLLATRGEFGRAHELYDEAGTVVAEVGTTEDVIRMRARQAQLAWLLGDRDACAAALADAEWCARRVTWPDALAELALAKAELARWDGDHEGVHHQLGVATDLLGQDAERAELRVVTHDLLGYLAADLDEARTHRRAACAAAAGTGQPLLIAQVLVGVADLALRRDDPEQAARLLGASTAVRGLPDRSHPDAVRIERDARSRLGEAGFAEATQEGGQATWTDLAAVTLD